LLTKKTETTKKKERKETPTTDQSKKQKKTEVNKIENPNITFKKTRTSPHHAHESKRPR
jgi:hypothetical protein